MTLRVVVVSACAAFVALLTVLLQPVASDEPAQTAWKYSPEFLRPFWEGETVVGESVLFIRDSGPDPATGEARASVLFPIRKLVAVRNSAGDTTYEEGRDYRWTPNSREIVLPAGSRIVARTPQQLRRSAGTQKYRLTHRDGNGEILFAAGLEYAAMQTCITYEHEAGQWKLPVPKFDAEALPQTVSRLRHKKPVSIVVLGDSISTGLNSSQTGKGAPWQPGYPELLRLHLTNRFQTEVKLTNFSISGIDTKRGMAQIENVVEANPDIVIVAFGMNDSSGRSANEYQANTKKIISGIRDSLPETEFILVASMLGNRGWTALRHELFSEYRDALAELCEPGIALADLTSVWTGFLELKKDWDQTGNGVNHPNDFGHRVYAQVISTLLDPRDDP